MIVVDALIDDPAAIVAFVAGVRALSPTIRIVVMSRLDVAGAEIRCTGADAVIRKTFRPLELVDALLAAGEPAASPRGLPC